MKLFTKKEEGESLRILNEKEIQKRLYGKYHLEQNAQTPTLKTHSDSSQLEVPKLSKPFVFPAYFKVFAARMQGLLVATTKKFPWKFAMIVTGALTLAVILLQVLSIWFGRIKPSSPPETSAVKTEKTNAAAGELKAVESKKIMKTEEGKIELASTSPLSVVTDTKPETLAQKVEMPKRKYYAVQVCTFQREQDAQRLTTELRGLSFEAFYLRMGSSQQRQPHYVVFLSREETYAAADSKLNTFRKTRSFEQFSDSYIRSI